MDDSYQRKKNASVFEDIGTLYYTFFLALELYLEPAEKATGMWDLGDREIAVKRLAFDWYLSYCGGLTGSGYRRLIDLLDPVGDHVMERKK